MARPVNNSNRKPIEIVLPKPTAYQQEAHDWLGDSFETGKVMVIKSVRQSGKTFFIQCELTIMAMAHAGCTSVVYEPTLALARNVYKSMVKAFEPTGLLKVSNAQLLEIEFVNGSTILFKSTEQMSRGLTVTGILVLDECAYLDNEAIFTILPFCNAHNAPIIIASTPFTMDGYFYEMYMKGLEENPSIKTFDWSHHPEISRFLTEEKRELYKQTMSRQKYRTEIDGEFLTDQGMLFQNIDEAVKVAEDTSVVYMGIDFGTGTANDDDSDYTVLAVFNDHGEMLKIYRTNNLSPMQQVDWLSAIILDWASTHQVRTILAEWNSIGSVYIDALHLKLKSKSIRITNWVTSNKSKQELVTTFALALENGMIGLCANSNLLSECRLYGSEINIKTKTVTYNATKGHDDCVIAAMLGYYAYKKSLGNFRIAFA